MKFKFSIIMAIYNVEKYLEEAIEGVVNQTIGFEENIELILINDGSPDNCEEICKRYAKLYPDNIIYLKQKNQGVSAARNKGIELATGEYFNFCDSDDILSLDVCEKVYNFFEEHKNVIDVVSLRINYFEKRNGFEHYLDYKFNSDRVIDLEKEYNMVVAHISSAFIKKECFLTNKFNSKLKYGEDLYLVNKIILDKLKYGVLRTGVYNYRKRFDESSTLDKSLTSVSWYIEIIKYGHLKLFDDSKKAYGKIQPYIMYIVMYSLQWVIKNKKSNLDFLTESQRVEHIELVKTALKNIDDNIIIEQKKLVSEFKYYALSLKYNCNIDLDLIEGSFFFKDIRLYNLSKKNVIQVNILEVNNDQLYLEGECLSFIKEDLFDIKFLDNNNKSYELAWYDIDYKTRYGIDGTVVSKKRGFKVLIPFNKINSITVLYTYKSVYHQTLKLYFGQFAKINNQYGKYYIANKIIAANKNKLCFKEVTLLNKMKCKLKYLMTLVKNLKFNIILYRMMYYILKTFNKKEIWLVSDRVDEAKDNGIALYKYIIKQDNKNIKCYFVLSKKAKEYKEIKKLGKVINYGSVKHKILTLLSKNLISSHADAFVYNIFTSNLEYVKDLYNFNYVFLQHGIIKGDLSSWLHKQNKNMKIFVTSVNDEYKSIVEGDYALDEKIVKLTGLPRYDYLGNNITKKITIMPTWRKNLAVSTSKDTLLRGYSSEFKDSEYFKFYNGLLNDHRIEKSLKKYKYTLEFYIHPALAAQAKDFFSNSSNVIVNTATANYSKVFKESALLVTDYSSVAFDFAYLNKKVLYTQFDKKEFFGSHIYTEGYSDYEKDGLGKVVYNYEDAVSEIIKAIENDCEPEDKYLKRIKKFYKFNDKNNCKRVYEEILKLK